MLLEKSNGLLVSELNNVLNLIFTLEYLSSPILEITFCRTYLGILFSSSMVTGVLSS